MSIFRLFFIAWIVAGLLISGCTANSTTCTAPTAIHLEDTQRPLSRDLTDPEPVREVMAIINLSGTNWKETTLETAGTWPTVTLRCDGATRELRLVASTLVDGARMKTLPRDELLRLTELLYGTGPLAPTRISAEPK